MSNIAWRNLVRGTASVLFAAGISAPTLADEASDQGVVSTTDTESAEAIILSDPITADVLSADAEEPADAQGVDRAIQIAQGVTTYERRRSFLDQPLRGQTVRGRARPQYDPLGVRVGSFVLLPELAVQEQYETNIFADPNNETDDFITRVLPNVTLRSDWNNHLLQFETGGDFGFYAQNSDENFQDYFIGTSGRVDIRRSTELRLGTRYRRLHESRESPDDAGGRVADEPTEVDVYSAEAAFRHDFGRVNATLGGSFDRLSFDDPEAVTGPNIIEHDRDRNIYEGTLRVGYEIVPEYEAFVLGSYNWRRYDGDEIGTDINRDSDGYGIAAGMEIDFGGIVFGEFFIGYRSQDYDDSDLDDFDGVGGGADITWNVTGLTTVTGSLTGDVRETTQADASGRLVATGEIGVDHELRRNIILGANVSATRDDYEGISRTDWIYRAAADATYLFNRHLRGSFEYNLRNRDGDDKDEDFTNHVFLVRLGLQY